MKQIYIYKDFKKFAHTYKRYFKFELSYPRKMCKPALLYLTKTSRIPFRFDNKIGRKFDELFQGMYHAIISRGKYGDRCNT